MIKNALVFLFTNFFGKLKGPCILSLEDMTYLQYIQKKYIKYPYFLVLNELKYIMYQCDYVIIRKDFLSMKTYGIICEYNPFHNGHIYQIEETKRITGADHIVAIMSGNFVQRGDVAIMDKFKRAEIAVQNGVDLVVEMPVQYSLASAEYFARCGVMMLKSLRCVDGISFGSECGNIEELKRCAEAVAEVSTKENLKPLLEQGMSYPEAVSQLVAYKYGPLTAELLKTPNNTLAVEYIKAMKALGIDDMDMVTVSRRGAEHDGEDTSNGFASATHIRNLIDDEEDFSAFVPKETFDAINEYDEKGNLCWFDNLERAILYRMRTVSLNDLKDTAGVGQGLENRIFQAGHSAASLDQLIAMIKTKRYPEARVRRIILNSLIGVKTEDLRVPPIFGRILALNDRGAEIVKMAGALPENKFSFPFSTSLREVVKSDNKRIQRTVALNNLASDIYGIASRNARQGGMDFVTPVKLTKIEGFVSTLPEDLKTKTISPETPEEAIGDDALANGAKPVEEVDKSEAEVIKADEE